VVIYTGMDAQGGPMLKQMRALGIGAKFMTGAGAAAMGLTREGPHNNPPTTKPTPSERVTPKKMTAPTFLMVTSLTFLLWAPHLTRHGSKIGANFSTSSSPFLESIQTYHLKPRFVNLTAL
jgi:hypothetical protein